MENSRKTPGVVARYAGADWLRNAAAFDDWRAELEAVLVKMEGRGTDSFNVTVDELARMWADGLPATDGALAVAMDGDAGLEQLVDVPEARGVELFQWVQNQLAAGLTVYALTHYRRLQIRPEEAHLVELKNGHCSVRKNRGWVSINYCDLQAVRTFEDSGAEQPTRTQQVLHGGGGRELLQYGQCHPGFEWVQAYLPEDNAEVGVWVHPLRLRVVEYQSGTATTWQCRNPPQVLQLLRELEARTGPFALKAPTPETAATLEEWGLEFEPNFGP